MIFVQKIKSLVVLGLTASSFGLGGLAWAKETNAEKVGEHVQDAQKNIKRKTRRVKKKVRDATGNQSTIEDLKDSGRNAGDEIDDKANDVKKYVD